LPVPEHFTLDYKDVHWELERWSIFTSLPEIIKYDARLVDIMNDIRYNKVKIPDYMKEIN